MQGGLAHAVELVACQGKGVSTPLLSIQAMHNIGKVGNFSDPIFGERRDTSGCQDDTETPASAKAKVDHVRYAMVTLFYFCKYLVAERICHRRKKMGLPQRTSQRSRKRKKNHLSFSIKRHASIVAYVVEKMPEQDHTRLATVTHILTPNSNDIYPYRRRDADKTTDWIGHFALCSLTMKGKANGDITPHR